MLFAAVGVVGALGIGSTTVLKGPVSTMVKTNQITVIENRAELGLKLIVNNVITSGTPDCDSDGTIEALEWRDATGAEPAVISGGGYIPDTISAKTKDPWGRLMGYCVWDNGSAIDDATCGGATQKRLQGIPPAVLSEEPYIAVISAGPDQNFQTSCQDFVDVAPADNVPDNPLINRITGSDDIVFSYSYNEMKAAMGDNFIFTADTTNTDDAIATDQGLELSQNVQIDTLLDLDKLGGILTLPDISGASCDAGTQGQLFRDMASSPPVVMICNNNVFEVVGGSSAPTVNNCTGKTTGICIGFDPELANCEVNNGGPLNLIDTFDTPGRGQSVWGDGTYVYVADDGSGVRAYTFDGATLTEVASFNTPDRANDVTGDGTYIYVADFDSGIRAYTFDGTTFTEVGSFDTSGSARAIHVGNDYLYVADAADGIKAYTFDGTTFTEEGVFDTPNEAYQIWEGDSYIYMVDNFSGLRAYTFDGTTFTEVGVFDTDGNGIGIWGDDDYIYVGDWLDGLKAYTFNGTAFTEIANITTADRVASVWGDGTYIYASGWTGGAHVFSFDGASFTEIDNFIPTSNVQDVWSDGSYTYVANDVNGVHALSGFECTSISGKPQVDTKIDRNFKVYGWGLNDNSQLGDTSYGLVNQESPVEIDTLSDFKEIAVSGENACGLKYDGSAWCWGFGASGRLGNGQDSDELEPVRVLNISDFKQITVGNSFSCGVRQNGEAWCWGSNSAGQLGNDNIAVNSNVPVRVSNISDFEKIESGQSITCGVRKNGEAWCWGSDVYGKLGNGDILTTTQAAPSKVRNISNIVDIAVPLFSQGAVCAVSQKGEVWCWGPDHLGQLGNGPTLTADQSTPTKVKNISNIIQVDTGGHSVCALEQNGTVWCWGDNANGRLGAGPSVTTNQDTPVEVVTYKDFVKISTGSASTCGLRASGEIWCWGIDTDGRLGNGVGVTAAQNAPYKIDSSLKFTDIFPIQRATFFARHKALKDGNEDVPEAPYIIQQSHDAGESVGSHGLAITRNSLTVGESAGIALTVDEDSAGADPASVRIQSSLTGFANNYDFSIHTGGPNRLRMNYRGDVAIGSPGGSQFTNIQVGSHNGAWDTANLFKDGLLVTNSSVAVLNPSFFGVNEQTGDTTILSGKELLIQHSDNTGATITPVATFLSDSGSQFFGNVLVKDNTGSFTLNAYTDTAGEHAAYNFLRYGGDATSPAAVSANNYLGSVRFFGYDGTLANKGANIHASSTFGATSGNLRTHLSLGTHPTVTTLPVLEHRLRITFEGKVGFGVHPPKSILHIGGRGAVDEGVKFSNDTTCASAANDEGTIRFTGTAWEYCDGSQWLPMIPESSTLNCTDDATFVDLSLGNSKTCGVMSDGQVMCVGDNAYGILANGDALDPQPDFIPISRHIINDAKTVSTAWDHTCILKEDGTPKCWGLNWAGQVGNGTLTTTPYPTQIATTEKFKSIDTNAVHSCGVTQSGKVMCWGRNDLDPTLGNGVLGNGAGFGTQPTPEYVYGIDNATHVSTGFFTNCAVLEDQTVKCWGENTSGQVGNGTVSAVEKIPVQVTGLSDVVTVDVGGHNSSPDTTACAVKTDGTIWCWGDNASGQLGNGNTGTDSSVPVQVSSMADAVDVQLGGISFACALRETGQVECWGSGDFNVQGDGGSSGSNTPGLVSNISTAVKIDAGFKHACAILQDGSMQCWGQGHKYQLGNQALTYQSVPDEVTNPLSCKSDKYAFVTSKEYDGNLGGLEGADAICQAHAEQGRLPGTYKAWLSDDTESPSTRFNQIEDSYRFFQLDNDTMSGGWNGITDGTLGAALHIDELGNNRGAEFAWSNTKIDGTIDNVANHCNNWRSNNAALNATVGRTSLGDANWTSASTETCDTQTNMRLYCFQQ